MSVNPETGEILTSTSMVTDDMLAEIQSFDDAMRVVNDVFGGEVVEADKTMGTGFGVAEDKAQYIGVPLMVLRADRNKSDKGAVGRFWSLTAVTKDGKKVILNDGGTGIGEQMDALLAKHPALFDVTGTPESDEYRVQMVRPLLVKKGLRVSHYTHPEHGASTTYYLDTSGIV